MGPFAPKFRERVECGLSRDFAAPPTTASFPVMPADCFSFLSSGFAPVLANVSMTAEPVIGPITNSILVAGIVTGLIVWFVRSAMKRRAIIPDGKQNLVEFLCEFLYNQLEGIVGKKLAPRAFPLLATIFIYVLISNYFGLLPGVGTIGLESHPAAGAPDPHAVAENVETHAEGHFRPILRPATADLNMTLGMAIVFMLAWAVMTIREVGVWGFIVHTFGPKGGLKGFLRFALIPIFLFVGAIEIISILFRPISLSMRLFGNIFAGESLLHSMGGLGETFHLGPTMAFILRILIPFPFYFLELLVGLLQAIVFSLLCAVYIQLSTTHEEGHEGHADEDDATEREPRTAAAH